MKANRKSVRLPSPPAPCPRPGELSGQAVASRFDAARAPLRAWFAAHARDLPWRVPFRSGDAAGLLLPIAPRRSPYAVWISEIMLQQTVVNAVIPHFERWRGRFPDVRSLAEASGDEVLRAWAGLGYYARARNLHKGARALVEQGAWPVAAEAWRAVPGVGEYTAGAIASLAFGLRAPLLDGNVARVFSRLLGLEFLPGDGAAARRAYWDAARTWVEGAGEDPGALNEALMELGALVCTPAAPRCGVCPLAHACAAREGGWQSRLPPAKRRAAVETVPAVALLATHRGRFLAEVRREGFLAGHAMFPLFLGSDAARWRAAFRARYPAWSLSAPRAAGRVRHAIMAKRYEVEVWTAALAPAKRTARRGATEDGSLWLAEQDVDGLLSNALARKIRAAGRDGAPSVP